MREMERINVLFINLNIPSVCIALPANIDKQSFAKNYKKKQQPGETAVLAKF